ncbi:MAG: hypothetical protein WC350_05590 [Candidatus Micrarchaeia archaeon]|jgi:hypothetical protein
MDTSPKQKRAEAELQDEARAEDAQEACAQEQRIEAGRREYEELKNKNTNPAPHVQLCNFEARDEKIMERHILAGLKELGMDVAAIIPRKSA